MKLKQAEKLKVVVDTNTIISAPLSKDGNPAKIFELILLEEIINFTSLGILAEVQEVFTRNKIKNKISKSKIDFIINNFKKLSRLVKPNTKLDIIKEDSDDNKVLECAAVANADYIISGDIHLLKLKDYKDIKIVSPKEFFEVYLKHIKNE